MAAASTLALNKQLKRELAQQAWLRQNLPRSRQQQQSQRRIFQLRTQLALELSRTVNM